MGEENDEVRGRKCGTTMCTYRHHGEEDKASSRSLLCVYTRMDQAVRCRGRQHQAAAEITDNCHIVRLNTVEGDHEEHAHDQGKIEDQCPVGVERKFIRYSDVGDDGRNERNEPRELELSNSYKPGILKAGE